WCCWFYLRLWLRCFLSTGGGSHEQQNTKCCYQKSKRCHRITPFSWAWPDFQNLRGSSYRSGKAGLQLELVTLQSQHVELKIPGLSPDGFGLFQSNRDPKCSGVVRSCRGGVVAA